MENSTELRTVVHSVLLNQIQFGVYHCKDKLPTIEETGAWLCVSVDTARAAYLELKEEGYITLSKNVGATVKVDYSAQDTEQFIQTFFASRKTAISDLADSMKALLSNAQWHSLKKASPKLLTAMKESFRKNCTVAPYAMLEHLNQKYNTLGNSILMRLVWQMFMFLHDPFFSIEKNVQYFEHSADYLPRLLSPCRKNDWPALRTAVNTSIERLASALSRFYEDQITMAPPENEIMFSWSSYKKSHQLCYTFAMELLIAINRGVYPVDSLLPSQKALADQYGISLSTVRRAFTLLDSVGAIKSAKYVGTQVLPLDKGIENSDFTNPVLRRRLLDMAESLQLLALSGKDVALLTLSALNPDAVGKLCQDLKEHRQQLRGETLSYFVVSLIAQVAPYSTIRTVYTELLRQFFWAYALRGMKGSQEYINTIYMPYTDVLIASLEKKDFSRFADHLEALMIYDLRSVVSTLIRLGIPGAESILIPEESSR